VITEFAAHQGSGRPRFSWSRWDFCRRRRKTHRDHEPPRRRLRAGSSSRSPACGQQISPGQVFRIWPGVPGGAWSVMIMKPWVAAECAGAPSRPV